MGFNPSFFRSLSGSAVVLTEPVTELVTVQEYKSGLKLNRAFFDKNYKKNQERLSKLEMLLN